jgi:tetratricopeptide (TPR) repeat protein
MAAALLVLQPLQAAPIDARGGQAAAGTPPAQQPALAPPASATPESPQAAEFRAGIQAQLRGDPKGAKTHFDAAVKIDPKYVPALLGLAGLAQAQGQAAQVESYLQQAERAAPKAPEVHLARGRYLKSKGQFERAEKSFLQARELGPKLIPPLLELGDLYLAHPGRGAAALEAYRAAAALDAGNAAAQYGLGAALATTGQRNEALQAFGRAAELVPKDPAPLRATGRLQLEAKQPALALDAFDRGLARQPGFAALMLDRTDALAQLARWDDALAQLTTAEKLAGSSLQIHVKRGDVLQGAQRWEPAQASYLAAIDMAPTNPIAYNNLAWMTLERKGDAHKAVAWARKAVSLSPRSSPFHDTLGWALRAAGDAPGAQASLKQAIALEPNVAGYHLHLGQAQAEAGQPAAARASLQKAIELDPKGGSADEARRLLKGL